MIHKLKLYLALLLLLFTFMMPSALVYADCDNPASSKEAVKCGTNKAAGESNKDPGSLNIIIARALNILGVIAGIVAVVMIIVAGFRYITSGGASDKVTSAKNALLYAIIGLIIIALAQIIVKFVLKETTKS